MAAAALGKVQTGRGAAWVLSPCWDQQGCACPDGAVLGHSPLQGMGEVSPTNEPQRPRMVEKCLLGSFYRKKGKGRWADKGSGWPVWGQNWVPSQFRLTPGSHAVSS